MNALFIFNLVGTGILFKLNLIQNTHRVEFTFMCVCFDILQLILEKREQKAQVLYLFVQNHET